MRYLHQAERKRHIFAIKKFTHRNNFYSHFFSLPRNSGRMRTAIALLLLLLAFALAACAARVVVKEQSRLENPQGKCVITELSAESMSMENGFVRLNISLTASGRPVVTLQGDTSGKGVFGRNVLAGEGISLDLETTSGSILPASKNATLESEILPSGDCVLRVKDIASGAATENWTFSLPIISRSVHFETSGSYELTNHEEEDEEEVSSVHHTICMAPSSIYALFDGGVVQMKDADPSVSIYPSFDKVSRIYSLGGWGGDLDTSGNASLTILRNPVVEAVAVKGVNRIADPSPQLVALISSASVKSVGFLKKGEGCEYQDLQHQGF